MGGRGDDAFLSGFQSSLHANLYILMADEREVKGYLSGRYFIFGYLQQSVGANRTCRYSAGRVYQMCL